jgi:hypothetical protein
MDAVTLIITATPSAPQGPAVECALSSLLIDGALIPQQVFSENATSSLESLTPAYQALKVQSQPATSGSHL